jgi:predicted phage tail protein
MHDIAGGLTVILIFIGMSTPLIAVCLAYYFKKRLEHRQIMAAIEKGTPLSELIPPKLPKQTGPLWIKNLTGGIALLLIAAGIVIMSLLQVGDTDILAGLCLIAVILFAVGVSRIIAGILQRKSLRQNQNENSQSHTTN